MAPSQERERLSRFILAAERSVYLARVAVETSRLDLGTGSALFEMEIELQRLADDIKRSDQQRARRAERGPF